MKRCEYKQKACTYHRRCHCLFKDKGQGSENMPFCNDLMAIDKCPNPQDSTPKWQKNITDNVEKASLLELFEMYTAVCSPDDYDGEFTYRGGWESDYVEEALRTRISKLTEEGCPIHGMDKMFDGTCHGTHVREDL
jgi:hypothetical protein